VGVTVVIATHDVELVKASGLREIIVADGKVLDPAAEKLVVPSMEAER
jgi:ABC-type ATPase involved in cell division